LPSPASRVSESEIAVGGCAIETGRGKCAASAFGLLLGAAQIQEPRGDLRSAGIPVDLARIWSGVFEAQPANDPTGELRGERPSCDALDVGVVGDVRHEALDRPEAAEVFLPYSQSGFHTLAFVVRTAPGSPANLQALKDQIWALDPLQSIYDAARLEQLISKTLVGPRFNLFVLGGFALATLLLATTGVYGVMSFSTSQRAREFGVRVALGATRHDIVRLVLGEGLKLAGFGVIAGIVVALPLTRLLRSLLFGVTATDPVTFVFVSVALVLVAAAACFVPATRALSVNPVEVLRAD
jgi:hypothetical protein